MKAFEIKIVSFTQISLAHVIKVLSGLVNGLNLCAIITAFGVASSKVIARDACGSDCGIRSLSQLHADGLQARAPKLEPAFSCKRFHEVDTEYKRKQFQYDMLA